MNSTIPKRHAETLRNRNIPFQLKKRNTYRNGIDNLGHDRGYNLYKNNIFMFKDQDQDQDQAGKEIYEEAKLMKTIMFYPVITSN